jgi:hypothetical protein
MGGLALTKVLAKGGQLSRNILVGYLSTLGLSRHFPHFCHFSGSYEPEKFLAGLPINVDVMGARSGRACRQIDRHYKRRNCGAGKKKRQEVAD